MSVDPQDTPPASPPPPAAPGWPRLRERVATSLLRVAKAVGGTAPDSFVQGEAAAGMTQTRPFTPGGPLPPYDGYSRTPRSFEFVTDYNVSARPRSHERIAFHTLTGLIDSYDIAQACIYHRIDSIRSLEWSLVAMPGWEHDVSDAVRIGMAVLEQPDGETPWDAWVAEYLWDVLAYDAGCLYRKRNRLGQAVGLQVVDGTTIAPLVDYWGNTPLYPAEAYVQYINGLPWNWLTTRDLIYRPFRKRPSSPYGRAPLEQVLLAANTDLRIQNYFLQRFTAGNIPAAFASAPESWSPNQIEQFQQIWDGFMAGEQVYKSQIRWIPGGSSFAWSNEKDFDDAFSMFLLRKCAMAFHVVPNDLGLTDSVNRSTGETQTDVQHRVGDVPLAKHLSKILTRFLQDDLRLPLVHQFDFGQEQDDRLQLAQADQIYIQNGVISPSTVRELRYGLTEPEGRVVPRYIFSPRGGAVPLDALFAVAGPIDQGSGAPAPGAPLPHKPFNIIQGVEPNPAPPTKPLAVQLYGDPDQIAALPPGGASSHPAAGTGADAPVEKDGPAAPAAAGAGAATAGITTATGVYSYDLGRKPVARPEDEQDGAEQLAKAELGAYQRYVKARMRTGRWRDFAFEHADRLTAHRLNDAGRLAVRKSAGALAAAGLALYAEDTGRILMLQRGLEPGDPASGTWEFPGGHIEDGETAAAAAEREWQEETGCLLPAEVLTNADPDAAWTSPNGVYRGFVATIPREADIPIAERGQVLNPDDPDGDTFESIAWWDPAQLPGNPALRPELLETVELVQAAIATATGADPAAAAAKHGGMISLDLPPGTIPTVPGGLSEHHITIVYLGKDLSDEAFAAACRRAAAAAAQMPGMIEGTVGGLGIFTPSAGSDGYTPAFAEVDLPAAYQLRAMLDDLSASEHADYTPHVTLAYLEDGEALPDPVAPTAVRFTELAVHRGEQVVRIPLGPAPVQKADDADPKAPAAKAADRHWPGWAHDPRATSYWTTRLTQVLERTLPPAAAEQLARDYAATGPGPRGGRTDAELTALAAAWLATRRLDIAGALAPAINAIRTDGALIGAASADAVLASRPHADLGTWSPGDTKAARNRLAELDTEAPEQLSPDHPEITSIAETRTGKLARALAIGTAAGLPAATVGNSLRNALTSGLAVVAATELLTAISRAARWIFTRGQPRPPLGRWIADKGRSCPTCIQNMQADPRPFGDPYPSGLTFPPQHPNCACAVIPA